MSLRSWGLIVLGMGLMGLAPLSRGQSTTQAPANPASSSSTRSSRKASSAANPGPDHGSVSNGSVSNGVYRNSSGGFTCKVPQGWVLRTEEMNQRPDGGAQGEAGRVLLAAFARPPLAHGEDVNSSILIAVESASSYPGLKEAVQYLDPVTEAAEAQGFETVNPPYEIAVGVKAMVRADFRKNIASRVMRQSTLVMLARGYVVSFTFIGGTEDEVDELIGGLSFTAASKAVGNPAK
jgi:hypothetical protein